jgi:hypothetical protein
MHESYEAMCEGITVNCNRKYASKVDMFHKRQLIKSAVIPSYNHVFISFELCEEACKKLDSQIIKPFWTLKTNREFKRGRTLVANRLKASYNMGGWTLQ